MDISIEHSLNLLNHGKISLQGEFVWGSNYTFLVKLELQDESAAGVYKPMRGERPLWDFPPTSLAKREVAAFLVSEALGSRFVPPTVLMKNGPLGPGSLQLYIELDPEYHYFNFSHADLERLKPVAIFDMLINNADRKGSHILRDTSSKLWLIDHGVCFHVEEKLRTVIWDFVGQPFPDILCADLARFSQVMASQVPDSTFMDQIRQYLTAGEIKALKRRAERLVQSGQFPSPDPYRRPFPWPQL